MTEIIINAFERKNSKDNISNIRRDPGKAGDGNPGQAGDGNPGQVGDGNPALSFLHKSIGRSTAKKMTFLIF